MLDIKKAPAATQGLPKNMYPHYSLTLESYHGVFNRIPAEKEIVAGWYDCLEFFKQREAYHHNAADWYLRESHLMEAKAGHQLDLADKAHANYLHYLELIGMAICNGFSFHGNKSGVNHAG